MNDVNNLVKELRELAYPQKSHPGKAGRKPRPPELRSKKVKSCVYLMPDVTSAIRAFGDGSLSRGIEAMCDCCVGRIYTNPQL